MAAQFIAFGRVQVPAAGTPVQLVPPAIARVGGMDPPSCHALIIEALPTNTGKIWIGKLGLVKATYVQVLIVLPIPTVNLIPSFAIALTVAGNAINVGDLYLDADVAGEGVLVSALVA